MASDLMSTTPANARLKGEDLEKQKRGSSTRSEQKRNYPFTRPTRRPTRPRGRQPPTRPANPAPHPPIHAPSPAGWVPASGIPLALPADGERRLGETPTKQTRG